MKTLWKYKPITKCILVLCAITASTNLTAATKYIPVHYLVAAASLDSSGNPVSPEVTINELKNGFDHLNDMFLAMDVQFLWDENNPNQITYFTPTSSLNLKGFSQVSGDMKWDQEERSDLIANGLYKNGSVNIIIADLLSGGGKGPQPYKMEDGVTIHTEKLKSIPHEVGHLFGLEHTYANIDDGKVSPTLIALTILEGVDSWKNGDYMEDTKVDRGIDAQYMPDTCDVHQTAILDGNGGVYKPDGYNLMSSAPNTCRNKFSDDQILRMNRVLATNKPHLYNDYGLNNIPTCNNSAIVSRFPHRDGLNNNVVVELPWTQDPTNTLGWRLFHTTSTSSTGANFAVEGRHFMHVDSGNSRISGGETVSMLSPCYDLANKTSAKMSFDFNMYGVDTGKLSIEVGREVSGALVWEAVEGWSKEGGIHSSGDIWERASVSLSEYDGERIQLRLKATMDQGGGKRGDISVDNIVVSVDSPVATINDAANDVEESSSGSIDSTSLDLDLGSKKVGLHFSNVNVPQWSHITKAYIEFEADDDSVVDDLVLSIVGELIGNAGSIDSGDYRLTGIQQFLSTSSVNWEPSEWVEGNNFQTSDISAVVQELVNHADWDSENAMNIVISKSGGDGKREAEPFGNGKAPELHIEFGELPITVDGESEDSDSLYMFNVGNNNWRNHKGETPSNDTGPTIGLLNIFPIATSDNSYYYVETSEDGVNKTTIFQSVPFVAKNTQLSLKYNMAGSTIGSLSVWTKRASESSSDWVQVGSSVAGHQGDIWIYLFRDLEQSYGTDLIEVQIRSEAISGSRGDIAIDNIQIKRLP